MNLSWRSTGPLVLAAAVISSCAGLQSTAVTAEATGSPYFSLSRPGVYKVKDGMELTGRVCRLSRTTLLSPPRVRIEHISPSGEQLAATHAAVAAIYRRSDQACADYATRVDWALAEGELVRACFDRGRPCPANPQAKAVVAVPTAPAPSR